jgi:hypothetical protein
MDRSTRLAIVPIAIVLCGLAGCVVEGPPPPRQVVVERPPPPPVVYREQAPEVILRP